MAFNDRNAEWLTALFAVAVFGWLAWSARGGGSSPVDDLRRVSDDDSESTGDGGNEPDDAGV